MKNLARWFTDGHRQAIQAAIAALMPLLVLGGWVLEGQVDVVLVAAGAVLQLAQGIVGLALLRPSDAARWFGTVGRALIYALAGAVGPLGVAFRWWGDDTAALILTVTGLALTALASIVQIVNVQTIDAGPAGPDVVPVITTVPDRDAGSALERPAD